MLPISMLFQNWKQNFFFVRKRYAINRDRLFSSLTVKWMPGQCKSCTLGFAWCKNCRAGGRANNFTFSGAMLTQVRTFRIPFESVIPWDSRSADMGRQGPENGYSFAAPWSCTRGMELIQPFQDRRVNEK